MIGGFKSPLFILGISAAAATTQGGFVTPIPVLSIGAGAVKITQSEQIQGAGLHNLFADDEDFIFIVSAYMKLR